MWRAWSRGTRWESDHRWISRTSGSRGSAEEVALTRHDELGGAAVAADVYTADDGGGHLTRLAEHELRGAGDLVGDGDLRGAQLTAPDVRRAAEVA